MSINSSQNTSPQNDTESKEDLKPGHLPKPPRLNPEELLTLKETEEALIWMETEQIWIEIADFASFWLIDDPYTWVGGGYQEAMAYTDKIRKVLVTKVRVGPQTAEVLTDFAVAWGCRMLADAQSAGVYSPDVLARMLIRAAFMRVWSQQLDQTYTRRILLEA